MSTAVRADGNSFVALGPGGVVEIWGDLPETQETTAYSFTTGYLTDVRLYGENGLFKIRTATPFPPQGAFRRFLARTIYNPRIKVRLEYEQPSAYTLSDLKTQILACLSLDDDVLTQFHDAATIARWIENATTFSGLVEALQRAHAEDTDA